MRSSPLSHAQRHELGVLLVGGDWACAHGDLAGLADVARRLGDRTSGAIRAEVLEVARLCLDDYDRAIGRWYRLRARVHDLMIARAYVTSALRS